MFSAISLMDLMFTAKVPDRSLLQDNREFIPACGFLSDPIIADFHFGQSAGKEAALCRIWGLEVLLKGSNMLRLLQGLWVALRISLIAVVISIPLGLLFGVLMTRKKYSAQGNFQSVSGIYPHYAAVGITFPVLL